jgi:hypothetical protein
MRITMAFTNKSCIRTHIMGRRVGEIGDAHATETI